MNIDLYKTIFYYHINSFYDNITYDEKYNKPKIVESENNKQRVFTYNKNIDINLKIGDGFEVLVFSNDFNYPIPDNYIPNNIKKIIFGCGCDFNQILTKKTFPNGLIELDLSFSFNQIIEPNVLPESLIKLTFGSYFDQIIDKNVLPKNLKIVEFDTNFNKKLEKNVLPYGLKELIFSDDSIYNHLFEKGVIPDTVTKINLGGNYMTKLEIGSIPNNVIHLNMANIHLNIPFEKNILPESIEILNLTCHYEKPNKLKKIGFLPKNLKKFNLNSYWNYPVIGNSLPKGLKYLTLYGIFEYSIKLDKIIIPSSLVYLELNYYDYPIKKNDIPEGIECIKLLNFNKEIEKGALPKSLKKLIFNINFNQSLDGVLPENLEYLKLSAQYNQPLLNGILPKSLRIFEFSENYGVIDSGQPLENLFIPDNVNFIIINELNTQYSNTNIRNISKHNLPKNLMSLFVHNANNYTILCDEFNNDENIKFSFISTMLYSIHPQKIIFKYNSFRDIFAIINSNTFFNIMNFIDNYLTDKKIIGKVILKELTEKVFNPNRLLKNSELYSIPFDELLEIY